MRGFGRGAAAAMAIAGLVIIEGGAFAADRLLRVNMVDALGKPIPKVDVKEFHCRDMADEPLVTRIVRKNGQVVIHLPDEPVQVSTLVVVPDFGEITVYADNSGKGFSDASTVDFVAEAVKTRRLRVESAVRQGAAEGCAAPASVTEALARSRGLAGYPALAALLKAGEEMTLARAQRRISGYKAPREGFLFGCNAFGFPGRGADYEKRFKDLFNFGTANLYLTVYAPSADVRNFTQTDQEVNWLRDNGMQAMTCPPLYFARSVTPEWMKGQPWPKTQKICRDLMQEVAARYKGKLAVCEIVNEAHDMSNGLDLTQEQLVELADLSSKAAHAADPKALRIVNCAAMWADYAARLTSAGLKRRSPYKYLKDCIKAGVEFEITGLQLYYPEYDLLEIDRMLERYAALGKPIHITEMACSSAPGLDPSAQRQKASAGWHGPWTEDMQADWVVGVYTLLYSKPYIQAVSWWDLPDGGSFWPFGGMLRADGTPKPSYTRLRSLIRSWGFTYMDRSEKAAANTSGLNGNSPVMIDN